MTLFWAPLKTRYYFVIYEKVGHCEGAKAPAAIQPLWGKYLIHKGTASLPQGGTASLKDWIATSAKRPPRDDDPMYPRVAPSPEIPKQAAGNQTKSTRAPKRSVGVLKRGSDASSKPDNVREKNIGDALKLSTLLESINNLEKPVLGIVHGAALGGGMGLVSVCDFVLASLDTKFGFSEVRLGLVPAVIGPFVLAKLGESHARALFLSGMHFNAPRAFEIGFIHQVVDSPDKLEGTFQTIAASFTASAPNAIKVAKNFLRNLKNTPWEKQHRLAAEILATIRVTDEAKEGIMAFLEKRKANWAD